MIAQLLFKTVRDVVEYEGLLALFEQRPWSSALHSRTTTLSKRHVYLFANEGDQELKDSSINDYRRGSILILLLRRLLQG